VDRASWRYHGYHLDWCDCYCKSVSSVVAAEGRCYAIIAPLARVQALNKNKEYIGERRPHTLPRSAAPISKRV
jgi:hypothetical protein